MRSSCGRQHDEPYAEIMDAEAIMDALVQKRAELDESAPAAEADFHVVVRGGQWCFKRTGESYESIKAEPRTVYVKQWCVESGFKASFTASLASHGDATAMLLCRAWAAKMQHLYDLDGQGHNEGIGAGSSGEAPFVEDPELEHWFASSRSSVQRRISEIRALRLPACE